MARKLLAAVLILLVLTMAGCWDAVDINDKNILTIVVADQKDDEYFIYVEIPNLAGSQSSGAETDSRSQYSMVFGKGKTYPEARQALNNKMDKPPFTGTVRSLVLTNSLTRNGISEYMFRLQSNNEYRKTVGVVTTSEDVEELMAVQPENNLSVGYTIEDTMKTLEKTGQAVVTSASDVLEWMYSPNVCFTIPDVGIREGKLAMTGYTIICDGKTIGFLSVEESKGMVWFLSPNPQWVYVVPCGNKASMRVTVRVERTDKKITPIWRKGKLVLETTFGFKSVIMYKDTSEPLNDRQIKTLNQNLQDMLLEDLEDAVLQTHEYGCEYLNFDEAFRIAYPSEFEVINWEKTYQKATVRLSVKNELDPFGMINVNPSKQ